MDQVIFGIFILLPSMGLCYLSLSTFYGWVKAYLAISWVPIALFALICLFSQGYLPANVRSELELLSETVCWISLIQAMIGLGLAARAAIRKEDWLTPAVAAAVAALPFFLLR